LLLGHQEIGLVLEHHGIKAFLVLADHQVAFIEFLDGAEAESK